MVLIATYTPDAFRAADRKESDAYVTGLAYATGDLIPHFSTAATGVQIALANTALNTMKRHAVGEGLSPLSLPPTFEIMAKTLRQKINEAENAGVVTNDNVRFAESFALYRDVISGLAMITNPAFYKQEDLIVSDPSVRPAIAKHLFDIWGNSVNVTENSIMGKIRAAALQYGA